MSTLGPRFAVLISVIIFTASLPHAIIIPGSTT